MTRIQRFAYVGAAFLAGAAMALSPARSEAADIERVTSPGGIEAWLAHEPSVPSVSVHFAFRGGAAHDPADKAGLSHMVSGLLDEGAGDMDSLAFQQRLDELAVELRFNAGRDEFSGELRTLSDMLEPAFEMLALALDEPRFDSEAVERIRSQIQGALARDAKNPNVIARRLWTATVFPDHPYGIPSDGTPEGVAAITIDDLEAYAANRFARDNLVIGVAGDVTPEVLGPLLDKVFGPLPAEAKLGEVADVAPKAAGAVVVEPAPIPQSVVVFGHDGMKRSNPDYYAAYIVNEILGGGGFGSRLTEEVREKRGLAYGIYTFLLPLEQAALFGGGVATRNERVAETIEVVRSEIARMQENGPTERELADAKTYLTGSFPLRFDSNDELASFLVAMQLEDLGIDYLDRRNGYIEAVTLADARRVADMLLDPEALTVVIVGAPEGVTPTDTHGG